MTVHFTKPRGDAPAAEPEPAPTRPPSPPELPDFNGDTYGQYDRRFPCVPVIDRVCATPLAEQQPA
ncbi:hypothetical protein [Streptomyces sp. NBC_01451]|uniref:hypothetical protein n=1 Tax=Streptomyces sp. NBC_01451 TaxID=2903872 RepID=UPI002E31DECB|nr:hypothetical protein [Streptomyces sp. NBC_01451]